MENARSKHHAAILLVRTLELPASTTTVNETCNRPGTEITNW